MKSLIRDWARMVNETLEDPDFEDDIELRQKIDRRNRWPDFELQDEFLNSLSNDSMKRRAFENCLYSMYVSHPEAFLESIKYYRLNAKISKDEDVKKTYEDVAKFLKTFQNIEKFYDNRNFKPGEERDVYESVEHSGKDAEFVVDEVFLQKDPEKFWEYAHNVYDNLESDIQDKIDGMDPVEIEMERPITGDRYSTYEPNVRNYRLSVTDCYGGWDACFEEFPLWFLRTYKPHDKVTFRKAVDEFGKWLYDNAPAAAEEMIRSNPRFLEDNAI